MSKALRIAIIVFMITLTAYSAIECGFVVDLSPPYIVSGSEYPPADTVMADTLFNIVFTLDDDGAGVWTDSVVTSVIVNGLDTTDYPATPTIPSNFSPGDTIEVCVHAIDMIFDTLYCTCPPNVLDSCWTFYIEDPCSAWIDTAWFTEETNCDLQNVVELCYHLNSNCEPLLDIDIAASSDGGSTWGVPLATLSGEAGDVGVVSDTGVHCFEWLLSDDLPGYEGCNFQFVADGDSIASTFVALGCLDSRAPRVSISCPGDSVLAGAGVHISWHIEDWFYRGDPCSVHIFSDSCGIDESFVVSDTLLDLTIPLTDCESCTLIVAVRDSFCNWGQDTCVFEIIAGSITAMLIEPIDLNSDFRVISSCEDQIVQWLLVHDFDIVPESVSVEICGVEYSWPDPHLTLIGDTLTWDPLGDELWEDGDSCVLCLISVWDITGAHIGLPICGDVVIDLSPPVASSLWPLMEATVSDEFTDISIIAVDSICSDAVYDSIRVIAPLSGIDTVFYGTSIASISGLASFDTVTACAFFRDDCADYCDPNYGDTCWSFDVFYCTAGPFAQVVYPDSCGYITSCTDQGVTWIITDTTGFDIDDTTFRVRLQVDGPSGPVDTVLTVASGFLSWDSATSELSFIPDGLMMAFDSWDTVTVTLIGAYNEAGCPLDDIVSCWFIVDADPPVVLGGFSPSPDTVFEDYPVSFIISADVFDSICPLFGSMALIELWRADTVVSSTTYPWGSLVSLPTVENGDSIRICVTAITDHPDYDYCPPNTAPDTCWWVYIILSGGPTAWIIEPVDLDSDGIATSACDCQPILIGIFDEDGIDTMSIQLEVEGTVYDLTSTELSWDGDSILTFTPAAPCWSHGDTIDFTLIAANDLLGVELGMPLSGSFIADYEPPVLVSSYPVDGSSIVAGLSGEAFMVFDDSLLSIAHDSLSYVISFGGLDYPFGPEWNWVGDTFFFAGSDTLPLDSIVEICVTSAVSDSPDYCRNEFPDACIDFEILIGSLSASWLAPIDINGDGDTITACPCQEVVFGIISSFGIEPESTVVRVEGTAYPYDPVWMDFSEDFDSLTIDASFFACWDSVDRASVALVSLSDTIGTDIIDSVPGGFVIDRDGPVISITSPPVITTPIATISLTTHDSICTTATMDSVIVLRSGTHDTTIYGALSFELSSLATGDTLSICAFAHDDCADYCGPNYTISCFDIEVILSNISASVILPEDIDGDGRIISSCECPIIFWNLESTFPLVDSCTRVEVGGIEYSSADGAYYTSAAMDSLIWNLSEIICFADGEVVPFYITRLIDESGDSLPYPSGDSMIIDISPPFVEFTSPYPSTGTRNPLFAILPVDVIGGVEYDTFALTIDGIDGGPDSPYSYLIGDTIFFDMTLYPDSFAIGDTILIELTLWDIIDYCDPNRLDTSWTVILEDTLPPSADVIYPFDGAISACEFQQVIWSIFDAETGIDTTRIWLSIDGTVYSILDASVEIPTPDTLVYTPPTDWTEGSHLVCLDSIYDVSDNVLYGPICVDFYIDYTPPEVYFLSPDCFTEVHDESSSVVITLEDDTAGVYWGASWVGFADDTIYFTSDTMTITVSMLDTVWHDGDTVSYCVYTADSADYCTGDNDTIICCEFYIIISDIYADVIIPEDGAVTSCSLQNAAWLFVGDVVRSDIHVVLNDTADFTTHSSELMFSGDTLFFTPIIAWNNGDTVDLCLVDASDTFGVHIDDTVCVNFIVDLEPPVFAEMVPTGGLATLSPIISLRLWDEIAGLDLDSIAMFINGMGVDPTLIGDTLRFDPADSGMVWLGGDTVAVCVYAADLALYCGANSDSICWEFYISAGGPVIAVIEPPEDSLWSACASQGAIFSLVDPDGIDTSSIDLTVNGIVSAEWIFRNDSLIYMPSSGPFDGDTVTVCATASDLLGNPADDYSCVTYFIDYATPVVASIAPIPYGAIGAGTTFSISIADSGSGIDVASLTLWVNGYEYMPGDGYLTWDGEELYLIPESSFDPGETVLVCLDSIFDSPDLCDPNILDSCWEYHVEVLPDLWTSTDHVSLVPSSIVEGDSFVFEGVGFYDGVDTLPVVFVEITAGASVINRIEYNNIEPGDTIHEIIPISSLGAAFANGDVPLCLILDADDDVIESNEANNTACENLTIGSADCRATPNPFSPNGDLINDEVKFAYPGQAIEQATVEIYDVKGRPVVTLEDISNWNGMDSSNNPLPKGVYVYVIIRDGKVLCKGTIHIAK
ncbi:gliding motility-associated C-terminal domain-containing protein [bacterium]|nr:gliding motility-associated C-terminal domain-containing protein [bacterium]